MGELCASLYTILYSNINWCSFLPTDNVSNPSLLGFLKYLIHSPVIFLATLIWISSNSERSSLTRCKLNRQGVCEEKIRTTCTLILWKFLASVIRTNSFLFNRTSEHAKASFYALARSSNIKIITIKAMIHTILQK